MHWFALGGLEALGGQLLMKEHEMKKLSEKEMWRLLGGGGSGEGGGDDPLPPPSQV